MIAVVGCGYVGLVTAVMLARTVDVIAVEVDAERRTALREGRVPFDEPGLERPLRDALASGRLRVEAEVEAVCGAEMVLVAVPTEPDGADPTEAVVEAVARLCPDAVVVLRGTLPPARAEALARRVAPTPVVANPEFLRAGHAAEDFLAPARVVLGGPPEAVARVARWMAPLVGRETPIVRTDLASACLGKLGANAMLAVRVGFANELARLAAESGASVEDVVRIVGLDPRIGPSHLRPSLGFGGPCLPKDARMLAADSRLVAAALQTNDDRLARVVADLADRLGGLGGRRIAVWGLAFKPGVGDTRDSAAVALVARLEAEGAAVASHDPRLRPGDPAEAVRGADALVLATAWPEYLALDPGTLAPRRRLVADPASVLGPAWGGWERP